MNGPTLSQSGCDLLPALCESKSTWSLELGFPLLLGLSLLEPSVNSYYQPLDTLDPNHLAPGLCSCQTCLMGYPSRPYPVVAGHPLLRPSSSSLSMSVLVGSQAVSTLCEDLAFLLTVHQKPLPPGSDFQDGACLKENKMNGFGVPDPINWLPELINDRNSRKLLEQIETPDYLDLLIEIGRIIV